MSSRRSGPGRFELTKWYIDVVDRQGRSAIAYWTALRWGPLVVGWESLSVHEPGRAAVHRSASGGGVAPRRVESPGGHDDICWSSEALGCEVRCRPRHPAFGARLLEIDAGFIDWTCEAPAASVALAVGGQRLCGDGYVERISLTLPPWKLPISELRWGRWCSHVTDRSIVWVDWRGGHPLTIVLVDGVPAGDASVDDDRVQAGAATLRLTNTSMLHARTLGRLLGPLSPVARRLPAAWQALEERKAISVGLYEGARGGVPAPRAAGSPGDDRAGGVEDGWAIHETVRFP